MAVRPRQVLPPGWSPPSWDVSGGVDASALEGIPAPAGVPGMGGELSTPAMASPEDEAWAKLNEGEVEVTAPWDAEDITIEDPNAEQVPFDAADIELEGQGPGFQAAPWDAEDIQIESPLPEIPTPPGGFPQVGQRPTVPATARATANQAQEQRFGLSPTLPDPLAEEQVLAEQEGVELEDQSDLIDPYDEFAEQPEEKGAVQKRFIENATPEQLAQFKAAREERMRVEKENRLLEQARIQGQMLRDNEERRVKATVQAQAVLDDVVSRAQAMADSTPFDTWWESRDTGQKIAGTMAAIFGGFLLAKTGGKNAAIEHFTHLAEMDAEQKMASLREQRGAATTMLGQASDDFKNREAFRIASYEQIARQIESEIALLDPEGSAALAMRESADAVRAQAAKAKEEARRQAFTELDKAIGREQEQQRIDEEMRKNAESERMAKIRLAMARAKPKEQVMPREYFGALYGEDKMPPIPMTESKFKEFIGNKAELGRISSAETQQVRDVATTKRQEADAAKELAALQIPGVKTKSGKTVIALTDKGQDELTTKLAGTKNLVNALDDIKRIISIEGSPTDIAQNATWQRLNAKGGLAIANINSALLGGGVVREGDIEFAKKALLAGDLTGFKAKIRENLGTNMTAGIDALRQGAINNFNTTVKEKVRPEFVDDIIDLNIAEVKINPVEEDEDMKAALSEGGRGRGSKHEMYRRVTGVSLPDIDKEEPLTRNQQLGLQGLAKRAASEDPDVGEAAAARLLELAKNDDVANPVVRDSAARILSELADQGSAAAQDAVGSAFDASVGRFAERRKPSAGKKAEETVEKVRKSVGLPGNTKKGSVTIDRFGRVRSVVIETRDGADEDDE